MKYVSIDLETTGLYPNKGHQILTFSCILEDTSNLLDFESCPKMNLYILRESITGSHFALNMNSKIVASISRYQNFKTAEEKHLFSKSVNGIFIEERHVPFYLYAWCLVHIKGVTEYLYLLDPKNWVDLDWIESMDNLGIFQSLLKTNKKISINAAGKNFASFDKKFIDSFPYDIYEGISIRQRIIDPAILFVDWETDEVLPTLDECKKRSGDTSAVTHDSLYDAWDVIRSLRYKYK